MFHFLGLLYNAIVLQAQAVCALSPPIYHVEAMARIVWSCLQRSRVTLARHCAVQRSIPLMHWGHGSF
jgi:hypothetical protein